MKKVAIIYWSGTGNTEMMANAIFEGSKNAGADASLFTASEFTGKSVNDYDAVILGCPSMGAEVLEETEFQPMFDEIKGSLGGKTVGLFGSYGWGDGEWMRNWEEEVNGLGADMPQGYLMVNETPDDSQLDECRAFGGNLSL